MKIDLLSLTLPGDQIITPPPEFITTPGKSGLGGLIQWVIIIMVAVAAIAALIFLIWGAIKWITSSGDKEKLESARKTILYSVMGLILVLLSIAIMQFVGGVMGVRVFDLPQSDQPQERQVRPGEGFIE